MCELKTKLEPDARAGVGWTVLALHLILRAPHPALTLTLSTPQAFPTATSKTLETLSAGYASFLSDYFLPCIPPLPITATKFFVPTLHLAVLSADGGLIFALVVAARAAFSDLAVPVTKNVGTEATEADTAAGDGDLAGIKGAIAAGKHGKGKAKARARGADDWDIDGTTTDLPDREDLPVPVTLYLIPGSESVFVDATPREEEACPARIHVLFRPSGRICGVRMEGDKGVETGRIRPLLEVSVALQFCDSGERG
jgi:exosome complex component RRP42